MLWLLYSPLHWIISGMTMVINFTGRKTGKPYRLPVDYRRVGNTLLTTSYKPRTWWRNLRGGAEVTLRLQGKDVKGQAEVIEDEQGVMEGVEAYIERDPRVARLFGIRLGVDGMPDPECLRQAASTRVIVRTTMT